MEDDEPGPGKTIHDVRRHNSSNGDGGVANNFDFVATQLIPPGGQRATDIYFVAHP